MKNLQNTINFIDDFDYPQKNDALIISIPRVIKTKEELLNYLSEELSFPNYFGKNWDAFEEMINDLQWVDEEKVIINHESLDELPKQELETYIQILNQAIVNWMEDPVSKFVGAKKHELVVNFPKSSKYQIEEILNKNK